MAKHGHGIGVVEQYGMGTQLFHIATDVEHCWNSPQRPEDAAWPSGIADIYVNTVFLWNQNVMLPYPGRATEYGDDDRICAFQHGPTVRGRSDRGWIAPHFDDFSAGTSRKAEAFLVDIDQGYFRTFQQSEGENVPN